MVTIDSSNGYVKSIIGGKDFTSGNFNRATMSKRQPGSAFKPFVYFTALNKGYQMNEVLEDSEVKFGSWEPQNYSETFEGNMTILEGMEKSVNIIAIKLLQKIGIKNRITSYNVCYTKLLRWNRGSDGRETACRVSNISARYNR